MVGFTEFLIFFTLLAVFIVYAVSKSRGVRIFAWAMLAITVVRAIWTAG